MATACYRLRVRVAVALAFAALPGLAAAEAPLTTYPPERLAALAPLLTHAELAAIEVAPNGSPRQITLLAWTPAPPPVAYEVVAHPERYPEFVRNLSKAEVERMPDGSTVARWQMELPIGHFNGAFAMRTDEGAIDIRSLARDNHTRWEFVPAPGGGTVIVEYAHYQAPRQNAILSKLLERDPANETGMGLAATLVLAKSVAAEAAKRAAAARLPPVAAPRGSPSFDFLLERGAVAVIRSAPSGALIDVSVVRRIPAPLERVLSVLRAPERWREFMPAVTASKVVDRRGDGLDFELSVDGVLLSVDTRYRMQFVPAGADSLGVGGDLAGSRFRWDLTRTDGGTLAIYRANHNIAAASILLRAMIGFEPLFEHGANVGVGIIAVEAVARRAAAQ